MNTTLLTAITALAVGAAVAAHADNEHIREFADHPAYAGALAEVADATYAEVGTNIPSLASLLAEWDQAGFTPPSKPSQYHVYGRNGYVTSGPEYDAMVSLIRGAVSDASKGRDRDAESKIAKARSLLAVSHPK